MARRSLDDLNLSESNIHKAAIVKDENGNEFVCNTEHLIPASQVDENLRSQCVRNIPSEEDTE
ncbi:MAG: hypothetical protein K9K39_07915 [Desulfohalobiaceae bacterium]|nr:hypothetical protein [Desulfohalobiaceae bacterium]